jgi:predicted ATP-dependent protease
LIPKENWQEMFESESAIQIIPVERIEEVIKQAIHKQQKEVSSVVIRNTDHLITA